MTVALPRNRIGNFTGLDFVAEEVAPDMIASDSGRSKSVRHLYRPRWTTLPGIEALSQEWIVETLSRLQRIATLPTNWDNEGSPRMDPSLVQSAEMLLSRLLATWEEFLPAPDVCPISGGHFQFEWQVGGRYLEIQFCEPDVLIFLTEESTPQGLIMISGEFPAARLDQTRRLLYWLIGKRD